MASLKELECHYKELYRFRDLYYAVNIFNLKNVSPNPKKIPSLQVQIMNDFCIPTFNFLQNFIPEAEVLFKRVESNLKRWEQLKAKFEDKKGLIVVIDEEEEMSVEDLLQKEISEDLIPDILKKTAEK